MYINGMEMTKEQIQRANARQLGVEGILCDVWSLEDERAARLIVLEWAERVGKTGPKHKQSRGGVLNRIRRDGLERGRERYQTLP